jgi:tetratricopeptide (TPR) repeat protein
MSKKNLLILGGSFYFIFLLLTPFGIFNSWVPPSFQTGYYSATLIDAGDDAGYYGYLRSVFFDGDLDFINERNYAHAEKLTPTGYVFNNWQIGQAVLFLPFFLIGHLLALVYDALGYPVGVDGYSAPYLLATAVASGTWLFLGLILVFQLARKFACEKVAWVTALSIWLASPLLYFTFIRQRMAHTLEFAVSALLLLGWLRWRKSKNLSAHAVVGGILGLLCMIRIINVAFLALFVVDFLVLLWADKSEVFSQKLKPHLLRFAAFSAGFFLIMLPQFYCWYQLNGFPFPPRHMKFAGEGLSGFSPLDYLKNLSVLLWSPKWGLILSMPLALLGFLGLGVKNEIRPALLAYLAGILSIILLYPEDSASYGHRHLISALPVLALGLARLLQWCFDKNKIWPIALGVIGLAVLGQYFMVVQYKVSLPYNHPEFTLEALGNIPHLILENTDQLLRSTNFFRLIFVDNPAQTDFRDILYLFFFPLAQLIALGLIGWLALKMLSHHTSFAPKLLMKSGIFVSFLLTALIAWAAPTKTEKEIQTRQTYFKHMREGDSFMAKKEMSHAREMYKDAARLLPSLWNPYFKIGSTWNAQGRLDEANRFYTRGLEFNPVHPVVLTNFGSNLVFMGKFDEAKSMLRAAIRAWPSNKNAYDVLAQALIRTNHPEEAVTQLKQALAIDSNYGPGHANLAVVYTMLKKHEPAKIHLSRAIALGVQGRGMDQLIEFYEKDLPGTKP